MLKLVGKLIRGPTRKLRLSAGIGAVLLTLVTFGEGPAAQVIMPHDQLEALLNQRYGETPVAQGLAQNGWLTEVYASPDGATWTIVVTTPQGLSQIRSAGSHWSDLRPMSDGRTKVAEAVR